jgi:hypothetical protein
MVTWKVMKLAKRTYSLPPPIVQRFEKTVAPGERSSFVAKLLEDWFARRERLEMRRRIVEGCREMKDVYLEIDREWNGTGEEAWRDLDPPA